MVWKNTIKKEKRNTEVGKSRFIVVHMEKDMQVMIITRALIQVLTTVKHFAHPCNQCYIQKME